MANCPAAGATAAVEVAAAAEAIAVAGVAAAEATAAVGVVAAEAIVAAASPIPLQFRVAALVVDPERTAGVGKAVVAERVAVVYPATKGL